MTDCDGKPLPSAPRCGRDLGFPLFFLIHQNLYWPLRCTTRAHVCHAAPWLPAPGNPCSPHPARTIGQILERIERPGDCPGASQDCDGETILLHPPERPAWCHPERTPFYITNTGCILSFPYPRRCQDLSPRLFGRWCYGVRNFPLGVCAPWHVPARLAA